MSESVSAFTPDHATQLPGPDWLRARRLAAAERFAAAELPTTDEEVWRYSRIEDLDLDRFTPLEGTGMAPAGRPRGLRELIRRIPDHAGGVILCNGRILHRHLDADLENKGVVVGPLSELSGAGDLLGSVAQTPADVFGEMNDAFTLEPVVLRVPAGVTIDRPIVFVHWIETQELATFPRIVVSLGEDSEASVLDMEATSDVPALTVPVVELDVAPAARLGYVNVQDTGPAVWRIASQVSRVAKQASLTAAQVGLGGSYARTRTDCRLEGRGARGDLLAAYFGEGDQMLDFRTFQDHIAEDTTSDLLFKGAVSDEARSVYTGLIRVRPEARGTQAFQTNRNIKLSEHAWAESVPNLEIENNDVRCSHASTVGPVDEEQRFYLESRGVPPATAARLVVTGFFDDVLGRLPVPGVVPDLRSEIIDRLERGEVG